jgi:hypothetical protein
MVGVKGIKLKGKKQGDETDSEILDQMRLNDVLGACDARG